MKCGSMDIDLVYLWCSNSEENYRHRLNEAKRAFLIKEEDQPDRRSTDNNELRFSLRSVEKFAPWVHHIYIVVSGQKPDWMDLNNPKITLVDDTEIVPKEYLPTFNSNVIEAFLHKIPGLSEHFLYACDDMMFGNDTAPDFFFTPDGKPIHYVAFPQKYQQNYFTSILFKAKRLAENETRKTLPPCPMPSHNIDPYTKTLYAETVERFKGAYQEMMSNKFRKGNDVQRFLVSCWGNLTDQLVWKEITPKDEVETVVYIDVLDQNIFNTFFARRSPNLFCLNDSFMLDESDYSYHAELLKRMFPDKSSFEKEDDITFPDNDFAIKPAFSEKNIPIVFTVDDRFLPYTVVALSSLVQNVSNENNYDVILLAHKMGPNIWDMMPLKELPANVSCRIVDIGPLMEKYKKNIFKGFPPEKITKWMKIFIPQLLKNYSKAIYLDADVLIKCDVAELLKMDLDGKSVGGVVDMAAHNLEVPKQKYMNDFFHCDNIDDYINLGLIVMDLNQLRQINFTEKLLNLLGSVPPDKWNLYDLFNAILHKNIKLIPMEYNYQYGILCKEQALYLLFKDEFYLAFRKVTQNGAKIVHFTGIKPWYQVIGPEGISWWKLAKKTNFYEMILLAPKEIPALPKKR